MFWKEIEQVENWEKGKEDFIDKCYISAVRKKHGVITEYLIKQNKISEWVSKKEALKLAEEGRLHAVVVHPKKRQAYLRPEFGSKSFEMA